jgi:hypothetical protein
MKPKLKKRKAGKLTDAMCPVCGEFMAMEKFKIENGTVNVYYCRNLKHPFTTRNLFEK